MHIPWPCVVNWCVVLTCTLFILCLHAQCSEAGPMHICSDHQSRPHPHGLCGRRLPMVLNSLCHRFTLLMRHSDGDKEIRKRQGEISSEDKEQHLDKVPAMKDLPPDQDVDPRMHLSPIFLEKKSALSYLEKRVEHGDIVCECCYHQCSVYELLQYCQLPGGF